jgi:hypothetical protein
MGRFGNMVIGVLAQAANTQVNSFKFSITTVSSNQSITLPHLSGYVHKYTVDYGDGTGLKTVTSYNDANCTHIYTTIGTYVVKINGICETFYVNNNRNPGSVRLLITEVISWGNVGIKKINFLWCEKLTAIPTDIYIGLSLVTEFHNCFCNCFLLTSIPIGLFNYCINATDFFGVFANCIKITSIPAGLFDNCPLVTDFGHAFSTTLIESIPVGLFNNNTLVINFSYTFSSCVLLLSIPIGLFNNNTLVTNFEGVFNSCLALLLISNGLFDNNTLVTTFNNAFFNNISLTGNAPVLWGRDSNPTGIECFFSATGLTNYVDIPPDWKLQEPSVYTVGTSGFEFLTLKEAFDYINMGGATGNIVLKIIDNTIETDPAILNASGIDPTFYLSVNIYPIVTNCIIGGDINSDLIQFNGTENVHINGRLNYIGNDDLTIENESTDPAAVTIHYINVTNTDVLHCIVIGDIVTE